MCTENDDWASLSYEEKNRLLFRRQKNTLDMFLERGAISQAQHDKSLHDLIEKMGSVYEGDSDAQIEISPQTRQEVNH